MTSDQAEQNIFTNDLEKLANIDDNLLQLSILAINITDVCDVLIFFKMIFAVIEVFAL